VEVLKMYRLQGLDAAAMLGFCGGDRGGDGSK
jgi:hypothetical protein